MFNALIGLGTGLVIFAIVVGVGSLVLTKFGSTVSNCPTAFSTYNETSGLCQNSTGSTANPSAGTITTSYLLGQLGSSGLSGWTPAIIALAVGLLFLGAFMTKKGIGRD